MTEASGQNLENKGMLMRINKLIFCVALGAHFHSYILDGSLKSSSERFLEQRNVKYRYELPRKLHGEG